MTNLMILNNDNLIWISILFFACAFYFIFSQFISVVALVPEEDRRYQDKLPNGFLVIWPLIRLFVFGFSRYLSINFRKKLHKKVCNAGADYILSAEQFFFAHFACGIYSVAIVSFIFYSLDFESNTLLMFISLLSCNMPSSWINQRIKLREKQILRELPTYLDILTLAMESGSNFVGALSLAVEKSPVSCLSQEFRRVLTDIKAGKPKAVALNSLRDRVSLSAINDFVTSILQSEKTGSPLGKILRAQADQRRFERFALAEKLGLEAPVKLLGPLVMFIFPTTFIIIVFLLVIKLYFSNILDGPFITLLMTDPVILAQQYFQ